MKGSRRKKTEAMLVARMPGWVRYIFGLLGGEEGRKVVVEGEVEGRSEVRTRRSVMRLEDS